MNTALCCCLLQLSVFFYDFVNINLIQGHWSEMLFCLSNSWYHRSLTVALNRTFPSAHDVHVTKTTTNQTVGCTFRRLAVRMDEHLLK